MDYNLDIPNIYKDYDSNKHYNINDINDIYNNYDNTKIYKNIGSSIKIINNILYKWFVLHIYKNCMIIIKTNYKLSIKMCVNTGKKYDIYNGFIFFCNIGENNLIHFYFQINENLNNDIFDFLKLYVYESKLYNYNNDIISIDYNYNYNYDYNSNNKINLIYIKLNLKESKHISVINFVITIKDYPGKNIKKIIKLYCKDLEFTYKTSISNNIIILNLILLKNIINKKSVNININNDINTLNLKNIYIQYMITNQNILFLERNLISNIINYNILKNELYDSLIQS